MNRRQILLGVLAAPLCSAPPLDDGRSAVVTGGTYEPLDRAFTEARLKAAIRECWANAPQPDFIIVENMLAYDEISRAWWQ